MTHLIKPAAGDGVQLHVTPTSAGWTYLDFSVIELTGGQTHIEDTGAREVAIVALGGAGIVEVGGQTIEVARSSVFDEMAPVVYVPPGETVSLTSSDHFSLALGGAPAEGRYPVRVIQPSEVRSEVRGGGAARRQVNHILAHPLPAERLILYEVYVPRGTWSGWPPHCHDGYADSPYLEETYYFRLDPADGFAVHRNWREDTDFDETLVAGDGDVVLVTQGFHSSVACPGSNMYFLNYLAGEPVADERATPPYFHQDHTWIEADWSSGLMGLPAVAPPD
jgi:5-deoxy-glucuronate isomerase